MRERRHHFPQLCLDGSGERSYPVEQVEKLHLNKCLLDQGQRPGKLMHLSITELRKLAGYLVYAPTSDGPRACGNVAGRGRHRVVVLIGAEFQGCPRKRSRTVLQDHGLHRGWAGVLAVDLPDIHRAVAEWRTRHDAPFAI
ncbi:hypothetical protein [Noviherbaspirillum massiliense]|uniref:hypothetical protein n=1 Tax=Noviherbaspirillum massiliense TaxID=1465823 RepID=UPI0011DD0B6B|nr:hypothetical protein [Noviherbaspirillum massiliense]